MPQFIVTSPDGRKFQVNGPEGSTQEDAINYIKNSQASAQPTEQPTQQPALLEKPAAQDMTPMANVASQVLQGLSANFADEAIAKAVSMASKLNGDNFSYEDALKSTRNSMDKYEREHPYISTALQMAGGVGGMALPMGVAAKGFQGADFLANAALRGGLVKQTAAAAPMAILQQMGSGNGSATDRLINAVTSPETAALAALGPVLGKVASGAGSVVGNLGGKGVNAAVNALYTKKLASKTDVDAAANAAYKMADDLGGSVSSEITDSWLNNIKNIASQTKGGKAVSGKTAEADAAINRLVKAKSGKPMGMNEIKEIDQNLTDRISSLLYTDQSQARKLMQVRGSLRDTMDNLSDDALNIGPNTKDSLEAMKAARSFWSAGRKMQDIQQIIDKGLLAQQPARAIARKLGEMAADPAAMRGYTAEERRLIAEAGKTNSMDFLKSLGSRLPVIAGISSGNPFTALASHAVSETARDAATSAQVSKVNKVTEAITNQTGLNTRTNRITGKTENLRKSAEQLAKEEAKRKRLADIAGKVKRSAIQGSMASTEGEK